MQHTMGPVRSNSAPPPLITGLGATPRDSFGFVMSYGAQRVPRREGGEGIGRVVLNPRDVYAAISEGKTAAPVGSNMVPFPPAVTARSSPSVPLLRHRLPPPLRPPRR